MQFVRNNTPISIHPPRAGRDYCALIRFARKSQFQSTRPVRGGTFALLRSAQISLNFNPPAPCGAGHNLPASVDNIVVFQSTRPVRGGTQNFRFSGLKENNFNPPAPCGAGRPERQRLCQAGAISIHPPRAGRDPAPQSTHPASFYFNPPAPCGAGPHGHCRPGGLHPFQSTRPVRGGTTIAQAALNLVIFQSTRPVRGGTRNSITHVVDEQISIHPPRAGRDLGEGVTVWD